MSSHKFKNMETVPLTHYDEKSSIDAQGALARRIVFVTAGELPFENTLQESQVLETALLYKKIGRQVSVISYVPIMPFILFVVRRWRNPLLFFKKKYAKNGIDFQYFFSFIAVHSSISFFFKEMLIRRASKKLGTKFDGTQKILFLARSYYATAICLSFRERCRPEYESSNVVFDSRSLLSLELAIKAPICKDLVYARAIAWEKRLVASSDHSLVMTKAAKERFMSYGENVWKNVHLTRLSGFNGDVLPKVDFEARWRSKHFVYVGYLGDWHDLFTLRKIFGWIKALIPEATLKILSNNTSMATEVEDIVTANYRDVPNLLNDCLAMIVPGKNISDEKDKYVRMQYEENMFSTKAAEGLNCGLPLIVNDQISGLAEYVRENGCGLSVSLPVRSFSPDGIQHEEFWRRATASAVALSPQFEREFNGVEILKLIENNS